MTNAFDRLELKTTENMLVRQRDFIGVLLDDIEKGKHLQKMTKQVFAH